MTKFPDMDQMAKIPWPGENFVFSLTRGNPDNVFSHVCSRGGGGTVQTCTLGTPPPLYLLASGRLAFQLKGYLVHQEHHLIFRIVKQYWYFCFATFTKLHAQFRPLHSPNGIFSRSCSFLKFWSTIHLVMFSDSSGNGMTTLVGCVVVVAGCGSVRKEN